MQVIGHNNEAPAKPTIAGRAFDEEINQSGRYNSIRAKLAEMDRNTQNREMQKMGATPEYIIGSVHAVTEDGCVLIGSHSGSQLGPYVSGAKNVVWIVGAQKLVMDRF